jgi:hypothetical protein
MLLCVVKYMKANANALTKPDSLNSGDPLMTAVTSTKNVPARTGRGILLSVLAAGVLAAIVNVIIGIAARAAGADSALGGMSVPAEISFTIIGVLIGAAGWAFIRRVAKRPGRVLAVLVPLLLVVSFIPDLAIGAQLSTAAAWTAVVGLVIMHVVTIAIAVPVYRRFLPIGS